MHVPNSKDTVLVKAMGVNVPQCVMDSDQSVVELDEAVEIYCKEYPDDLSCHLGLDRKACQLHTPLLLS